MREKQIIHFEKSIATPRPVIPNLPKTKRSAISPLAIHPDKFTYTFILNNEVISIHYDRIKGEIFYQGHNIKNLPLDKNKVSALKMTAQTLKDDEEGRSFIEEYEATLNRQLADNK